jgi:hypothetical protein
MGYTSRMTTGGPMTVTEFFSYLLASDATRDLALQLDTVYVLRAQAEAQEGVLVDA